MSKRLRKCPDCDHDVSKRASSCPNCGCPFKTTKTTRVVHTKRGAFSSAFGESMGQCFGATVFLILAFALVVWMCGGGGKR